MIMVKICLENFNNFNDIIWVIWKDFFNGVNLFDISQVILIFKINSIYYVIVYFYDEIKSLVEELMFEIWECRNYYLYVFFVSGMIFGNFIVILMDYDMNNLLFYVGFYDDFVIGGILGIGRLEGVFCYQLNGKDGMFVFGFIDFDVFFIVYIIL